MYNTILTTVQLMLVVIILMASQSEGFNPYGPPPPTTWVIRGGIPYNALQVSDDRADDPDAYTRYN
jgi:hypothetical protein